MKAKEWAPLALLWVVAIGLYAVSTFGCVRVKHDLDPRLTPYLFRADGSTIYPRDFVDAYQVCVETMNYHDRISCTTLGDIRRLIASRAAAHP